MTAGPGLLVDEVSVHYGDTRALDRFSLELAPGEVVAVLGPSGSGKSTLLRAVAGLEPLAGGRIVFGGRDLAGVPTHRRGLGLMFQDHGLFGHLSVADNIAYGLKIQGVAAAPRRERVAELLDLVGLEAMGSRRPDQLSGGEAQRVALARALAPEPGLLMLDEPLGSLDRALREQLVGDLRRLLSELGQTALHVTHDQGEAFALADRVALVDQGRAVAVEHPARLWADPGSAFVARFLGHPNIWTVTIGDDGTVRRSGTVLGRLATGHLLRSGTSGPIEVVLPVTAIDLARSDEEDAVPARIDEVVFGRGHHRVRATPTAGESCGTGRSSVEFETTVAVEVGTECRLRLDLDQLRSLTDDPGGGGDPTAPAG